MCAMLVGLGPHFLWPTALFPHVIAAPLGGFLIVTATTLFALSIREFRRAGTSIRTNRPTTALIRTGPYRFSRNPLYLALTLLYLGIGIWVNSAWILGMLIPTLAVISYGVIDREERYLTEKFGEDYLRYKRSVRRWL